MKISFPFFSFFKRKFGTYEKGDSSALISIFKDKIISSQHEGLEERIDNLVRNIIKNFNQPRASAREERNDCFYVIDELRKTLRVCPLAQYMHRENYLREAENLLNNKGILKREQNILKFRPLALRYVKAYVDFCATMKKVDIVFDEMKSSLKELSEAHYEFSCLFSMNDEVRRHFGLPLLIQQDGMG